MPWRALCALDVDHPPAPAAPHLSALALRFRAERALADLRRWRRRARAGRVLIGLGSPPGGCDQMIGRRFDGGVELSGGEWQ